MKMAVNYNSLRTLLGLQSPANLAPEDPYVAQRAQQMATGEDQLAPSDAELMLEQEQTAQNTGMGLSRDALRQKGLQQLQKQLGLVRTQYVEPKRLEVAGNLQKQQLENAGGLQKQQLVNQGEYAKQGLANEGAAATAAVPRTTTTNVNTGGGAQGGSSLYSSMISKQAMDAANSLLPQVNSYTTGLLGLAGSHIPTTQAYQFRSDLNFLKSNLIQKALSEMRAASKTGGALGQVSDYENQLLGNSFANLDQFNNPDKVKAGLQGVIASLQRWEAAKQKFGAGASVPEAVNGEPGINVNVNADPFGLGF